MNRNEELHKLEEENRILKEKMHRCFIQESGLEMLGKLEKDENDREKNKNLEEIKQKNEALNLKHHEINEKISGDY